MPKQVLIIIFLICAIHSYSQDAGVFKPGIAKKEMIAVQINSTIKVDGVLNEAD